MNPYLEFTSNFEKIFRDGKNITLANFQKLKLQDLSENSKNALIFSPHPDDECIVGALPLRLRCELNMNVKNVAITLGSKKERQKGRLEELKNACEFLGFILIQTKENGLENINLETREIDKKQWTKNVDCIQQILSIENPKFIFCPHKNDFNSTHSGVHYLIIDALKKMPSDFCCHIIETEFWAPLDSPNLMIESSVQDVANLVSATSFHVEEVKRNPYHLRLPAWMMDNVRRGAELLGDQGKAAPNFTFATLYRIKRYKNGTFENAIKTGKLFSKNDDLAELF